MIIFHSFQSLIPWVHRDTHTRGLTVY